MNNKKKIILSGLLGVALCIGLASTLAYFTDNQTQTNTITMGNVDITLEEPMFKGNPDYHFQGAVPREEVVKDPTITVSSDSADAYIRVKLDFEGLDTTQMDDLKKGINVSEDWKLVGNYIYYKNIAHANDVRKAFGSIVMPDWGNEAKNMEFKLIVTAEAVQADYFNPKLDDLGFIVDWPGVTIK